MTPEEIKSLCAEYAQSVKSEYVSAELIETLVMGFYHTRLKTDYCIVPKEVIYKVNKAVQRAFQDGDKVSEYGWKRIQNWLFGELFNEEKDET